MKERIQWIDTAKFLAIYSVYIAHMREVAGGSYSFVFQYTVPLFFFLSGCTSNFDKNPNFIAFVIKKAKTLLLPHFVFSFLSIIIETLYKGYTLENVTHCINIVLRGNIRNVFIAPALWFFSCLFVVEIVFKLIKYLKNKWLILFACTLLHLFYQLVIAPLWAPMPSWPYNVDSACYHIIFYGIGYVMYPYIVKLFRLDSLKKKVLFGSLGVVSAVYAILIFYGIDYIDSLFAKNYTLSIFTALAKILILIWFILSVARAFEKVELFNTIGRETLYLCGNEYIISCLVTNLLLIFGIILTPYTPLSTYVYTFISLLIGIKLIIPFEKSVLKSMKAQFTTTTQKN